MAENEHGAEKTEQPTPKRLEDARGEGNVAYSQELSAALELLLGFSILLAMAPWFWKGCVHAMRWSLSDGLASEITTTNLMRTLLTGHGSLLAWTGVFVLAMFVVAATAGLIQVGFHPTLKTLQPKWSKLSPITGLGRLFGMRGLVRLALNLAKLTVLIAIAYVVIAHRLPYDLPVNDELAGRLADDSAAMLWLGIKLAVALLLIAAADWMYQRWQHTHDLMMTKQEVKEEMKQSEGNPEVKGKLRQVARQLAQRRMMQEVPKADVIITNPTHVAVALKYDKDAMAAPIVLAKGYDEVAQKIKAIAAEHRIPMVENVQLARALAREVEIGHPIKAKWFKAVAEVLAMVYKLRKGAA
jgi:flagellar biosynthetic protein FlhB